MSYRILQLIGGGEIGGAEIHLLNLMLSTAKNQANFSLGCLCQNSPFALQAEKRDIPVTLFPMRFPLDILPLPRMISYCRKQKIDLIHAHGVRADFLGRLAAKFLAIPCISTVHSLWQDDYPSPWKGKIALYTEKLTLPLSAGLITISESLHHSLSALLSKRQSKKYPEPSFSTVILPWILEIRQSCAKGSGKDGKYPRRPWSSALSVVYTRLRDRLIFFVLWNISRENFLIFIFTYWRRTII